LKILNANTPIIKDVKTWIFSKKQSLSPFWQIQIAAQEFKLAQTHANKKTTIFSYNFIYK